QKAFTDRCYKGYFYSGNYWYTAWNLLRPKFEDPRVRTALARCFDFEAFKRSFYRGVAEQVTGPWIFYKPEYNRDVRPIPYEPERARSQLAEAGWYDRDGDGLIDKDGQPFELELISSAGNKVSETFAAKLQEDLAKVGIKMRYTALDQATLLERKANRDFDAIALGWVMPWESDPVQGW